LASVTVTVYVAGAVGASVIVRVVAPFDHWYVTQPAPASSVMGWPGQDGFVPAV